MSVEEGIAGFDIADVDFKRSLLDASAATALMLTNSKIETSAPYRIGSVADIDHLVIEPDAVAALTTTGYAGILAGPAGIGFVFHTIGLPAAFWLLAALIGLVPLLAWRITKKNKRAGDGGLMNATVFFEPALQMFLDSGALPLASRGNCVSFKL